MIEQLDSSVGNVVVVRATGKLTEADYKVFTPVLESAIQEHGSIRVLFVLHDFHGWDLGGFWQDIKFDAKHAKDVDRFAIVGDKKWFEWMGKLCNTFTHTQAKTFHSDQLAEAEAWVKEGAAV